MQKGVQAIFTSRNKRRGNIVAIVGLLAIGIGAALWMRSVQGLNGSLSPVILSQLVSPSLIPASLGFLAVLAGVGLCTYSIVLRRGKLEHYKDDNDFSELEVSTEQRDRYLDLAADSEIGEDPPAGRLARRGLSRTHAVAIVQSLTLMALYGGLVQEYNSNISMQAWIRANFALGGYLLNYNTMLVVAGVLGVLMFQFLPGGRFSD